MECLMNWDEYFNDMVVFVSSKSKDRSSKVGCVIVGPAHEIRTTGYNGFCRGINDDIDERHARPAKYLWAEHAERNAIYNAARNGISLEGCTAYVSMFPCADCARALIQSGVVKLVCPSIDYNTSKIPTENYLTSLLMMEEAGVEMNLKLRKHNE